MMAWQAGLHNLIMPVGSRVPLPSFGGGEIIGGPNRGGTESPLLMAGDELFR
jgi:hypothetical protein|uniref:Uncharacterized protein n=1 Tax=Picea glauca TaxID=3330 RepID=A0A124GP69_PICGL|nr:hypothetical protein ABT39_MTgene883 [Picea glauca]